MPINITYEDGLFIKTTAAARREGSHTRVCLLCSTFLSPPSFARDSPQQNPRSLQEWGLPCPHFCAGDRDCSPSNSQNPGPTGVNGKWAIDPQEAKFHPLLRLRSIDSPDLFPTPHWYLQAAGTCTYSAPCVTQTAWFCTVFSEQFPETGWYF